MRTGDTSSAMRTAKSAWWAAVLGMGLLATATGGSEAVMPFVAKLSDRPPVLQGARQGHDIPRSPFPSPGIPSIQAFAVIEPDTVLAGSFGMGVFRSENRGRTWSHANDGLDDRFVLALETTVDGSVYAGTVTAGIFRSRDGGRTWHQINKGLKQLQVKALLATDRGLFAGTGNGVYRYDAPAGEWNVVTSGLDDILVHALAMARDGSLYAGTSGKGVVQYTRRGSGWERLTRGLTDHEGLRENFIRVLAIDRDQALYAGTFNGGVFRSVDGGKSWKPISRALPNDSIRGIVTTRAGLFVATGRGVFRTANQGEEWAPVNEGLAQLSVQVLVASNGGLLYAGTNAGAFRSDDDGQSWVPINEGLEGEVQSPFDMFR